MGIKVFITGSWDETQKIKQAIEHFENFCEVIHDWTYHEDPILLKNVNYLKSQNIVNVDAIEHSDYLIVIMDTPNIDYSSTWTEIGIAIHNEIRIIMYNPSGLFSNNMYFHHPLIKNFDNMDKIINYLKE